MPQKTNNAPPQFEDLPGGLLVRAPAKINLSLLVAGKRPDGYHELQTIMAKIDWMDELLFEPGDKEGIELICAGPCWAPDGPDNLVYRACRMLAEQAGVPLRIRVTLRKNIPASTGLGSASSDAAAALLGLDRFLKLQTAESTIHDIAGRLGSDVPFFLNGPIAFCTGRGEKIHKINDRVNLSAILIVPNVSVSTKKVYENYTHNQTLFETLSSQINAALEKKSIDLAAKMCANMLQTSCFQLHSDLAQVKDRIEQLCRKNVCLSGSGSSMFVLFNACDAKIQTCRRDLERNLGIPCRVVNINRW
jgi:4-diphosphocytidyl-2-C-methyl-D-erythritol kinase